MFYVNRGKGGEVTGAWTDPQFAYQCTLAEDDPALMAYLLRSTLSAKLAMLNLSTDDMALLSTRVGMFVDRDDHGRVSGAWDEPQRTHQEMLPLDSPDLQAFLTPAPGAGK